MKSIEKKIKSVIKNYKLQDRKQVIEFIKNNPEELEVEELSRIAELVNNSRVDTAAYYTDTVILDTLKQYLPYINKKEIRILEPSVGVGNFLNIIIEKYKYADKLIIEVNDIDIESLELTKELNRYRLIPEKVEIIYHNVDFLNPFYFNEEKKYDLIIGNPPFLKLNKKNGLLDYSMVFSDNTTTNISGFFLQKSIISSDYIALILPKYFLNNPDFKLTRDRTKQYSIENIVDFGEKGFKGVLIETIAVLINTTKVPDMTASYSVTHNFMNLQKQNVLTSDLYPYWLLYRDDFFDKIASKMIFSVFRVYRDRQLTNKVLKKDGEIRVLKSRNIARDGTAIISIEGYDSYINKSELDNFTVAKYYDRTDVFLSPNMTYYPRVIKKPKNVIVNGSVAILENISGRDITDEHLKFLSGPIFEKFYNIARNYSTRSLNIDSNSVQFFGLYED